LTTAEVPKVKAALVAFLLFGFQVAITSYWPAGRPANAHWALLPPLPLAWRRASASNPPAGE
jgi:hypothetical protein